jgi:hypothetical protein
VAPECTRVTWKGNAKACNQHVQDTLDYVSIMDYKDYAAGAGGIITDGQNEINYGDTIGKKVIIGVETSQISARGDPEVISFQEEGRTYMEGQLDQVCTAFGSNSSFLGIGVHHRDSYRVGLAAHRSALEPGERRHRGGSLRGASQQEQQLHAP